MSFDISLPFEILIEPAEKAEQTENYFNFHNVRHFGKLKEDSVPPIKITLRTKRFRCNLSTAHMTLMIREWCVSMSRW